MDVGAALRDAREQRRLSVDQLSRTTKISVATLRAIEKNEIDTLPGGIFIRGFLRAYAREVGLDVEDEEELSLGGGRPLKRLTKLVTALRLLFAGAFLVGAIVLLELGSRWATRWQPHAVKQSGIFCYRGVVRGLRTAPDEGS